MQSHIRNVEKFTNYMMSPTGANSYDHTPQPNIHLPNSQHSASNAISNNPHTLSLRNMANRSIFMNNGTVNNELVNSILDKLLMYGFETSTNIAKMQPWQLRILKKVIPQIDLIFMIAYNIFGKKQYYNDNQNIQFRQYLDSAVWLQYNEIELIIKCFDMNNRTYQCMVCGTTHGLYELDVLRWHIWLQHNNSKQLNYIMENTKGYNCSKSNPKPIVISLLDDDHEMQNKSENDTQTAEISQNPYYDSTVTNSPFSIDTFDTIETVGMDIGNGYDFNQLNCDGFNEDFDTFGDMNDGLSNLNGSFDCELDALSLMSGFNENCM